MIGPTCLLFAEPAIIKKVVKSILGRAILAVACRLSARDFSTGEQLTSAITKINRGQYSRLAYLGGMLCQ